MPVPLLPPLPYTTSPVRSMWVAAADVAPDVLAGDVVANLVEMVRARRVTEVFLEAPHDLPAHVAWACRYLRIRRTYVAALGGEASWLEQGPTTADGGAPPAEDHPAARWVREALAAAPFHRVHLDLTPWTHPAWASERPRVWAGYLAALDAAHTAARGIPVDVDVPWWFATETDGGVPLLDTVLDRVSRVTVLVDAIRAEGPFGILARTVPVAQLCDARRAAFTVGVAAGVSAVGQHDAEGGAAFFDDAALEREAAIVRTMMRDSTSYRGFAVRDYRSWRGLLERGGARASASATASF